MQDYYCRPRAYRGGRCGASRMSSTFRNIMSDVNYGIRYTESILVLYGNQYLFSIRVNILQFICFSNVGTVMTSCAGSQHHIRPYVGKLERWIISHIRIIRLSSLIVCQGEVWSSAGSSLQTRPAWPSPGQFHHLHQPHRQHFQNI